MFMLIHKLHLVVVLVVECSLDLTTPCLDRDNPDMTPLAIYMADLSRYRGKLKVTKGPCDVICKSNSLFFPPAALFLLEHDSILSVLLEVILVLDLKVHLDQAEVDLDATLGASQTMTNSHRQYDLCGFKLKHD
jgi:hypothetical protein